MSDTIKVVFIDLDGIEIEVEAEVGLEIFEVALDNDVYQLPCVCGGGMSCASCHVHVADEWIDKVGVAHIAERDFMEMMGAEKVTDNSRLGCQIILTKELDGLRLQIVENDYNS